MQNHYEVLGLTRKFSDEELKKAYKRRALKTHPDKTGRDTEEEFRAVLLAYQVLSDPIERKLFEAELDKKNVVDNGLSTGQSPIFTKDPVRDFSDANFKAFYKFVFFGPVGSRTNEIIKTAAIDQSKISDGTTSTMGMDFCIKSLNVDGIGRVKLQLWDTAGQERNKRITSCYTRKAAALVFAFDLCNMKLWESGYSMIQHFKDTGILDGHIISIIFVNDSPEDRVIDDEQIDSLCKEFQVNTRVEINLTATQQENVKVLDDFLASLVQETYKKAYEDMTSELFSIESENNNFSELTYGSDDDDNNNNNMVHENGSKCCIQ